MQKLAVAFVVVCSLTAVAFGQQYAGERFTANASQSVSLNGGNLLLNPTTAFTGSAMPGLFAPSAPEVIAGTAYSIGPPGVAVTYTVTVTYNPKALPSGVSASSLRLYQVYNDEWTPVSGSTVNTTTNEVTGKLTATTTFAVLSGTPPAYESAIYFSSDNGQIGDLVFARYLTNFGKSEPLSNLLGLTGGAPVGMVVSPLRNGIVMLRMNPKSTASVPVIDAFTASIDGSDQKFLAGPFLGNGGPQSRSGAAFTADGTTLYASTVSYGSNTVELIKIALSTGAVTTLGPGGSSSGPSIGGGVLAYADNQTVTMITLATNTTKTVTSPTADGAVVGGVNVSNDGTKVIWATNDGAVYTAKTNGTGVTKLIAANNTLYTGISGPIWSPDGTMFAFLCNQGDFMVSASNPSSGKQMFSGQSTPGLTFWR